MSMSIFKDKPTIAVIGLGYVGLPLIAASAKLFNSIGYDIDKTRVTNLNNYIDTSGEIDFETLKNINKNIFYTTEPETIKDADIVIVTVPTPVDKNNRPDYSHLIETSKVIGKYISKNSIVVYESTVNPGATTEVCIPVIEKVSGLKRNVDFFYGYSPERYNPGNDTTPYQDIDKLVASDDELVEEYLFKIYSKIIKAKVHKAGGIKIAEAAKILENTQRDVNIALMNEFYKYCYKERISASKVLEAAGTKWNFLNFQFGLVGGHCIGVDPYYLINRAEKLDCETPLIKTARLVNSSMPNFWADIISKEINVKSRILILGITFKENCSDTRNSGALTLGKLLSEKNHDVSYCDPCVNLEQVDYISMDDVPQHSFDAVILAVKHKEFLALKPNMIKCALKKHGLFFDLKEAFQDTLINTKLGD